MSPVKNAVQSYLHAIWIDFLSLWSEYNSSNGANVTGSTDAQFILATFGVPAVIALELAGGLDIIIAIVEGFSLGAGFIATTLVGLVLSGLVAAAVSASGYNTFSTFFSGASVDAAKNLFDATKSNQGLQPLTGSSCPSWAILADTFSVGVASFSARAAVDGGISGLETFEFSMALLKMLLAPILAVVVGVLGMFFVVMVHFYGANENLGVIGAVIAGIGAILDTVILLRFGSDMPDNDRVVAFIGLAADAAAVGAAVSVVTC